MNIKLQDALIEIGKEVETIKQAPTPDDIVEAQISFNLAVEKGDMVAMRHHGRRLCALVTKMMVEEL